MKKFTIITATYNSSATLPGTIDSVLTQHGTDLEYLIIDGDSTDGTLDVIKDYAARDERIRWLSEPDEGIADAFNKGLKMVEGDWIGILNADDCYAPGALQIVADAIAQHPDAELIHGDMLRLDADGSPMFVLHPADVVSTIWRQMPLNHPTVFVSKAAYARVGGFDTTLRIAMDYDLILRFYKSGAKFVYLGRVLAHMRYGGASDVFPWCGLKEVRDVSVREGFPFWKANWWMLYRGLKAIAKKTLRLSGLSGLLLLHPRFRGCK